MSDGPLINPREYWLTEGAFRIMLLSYLVTLAYNYLTTRHLGLLDSQLIIGSLVAALILALGSFAMRSAFVALKSILGLVGLLVGLTTILGIVPINDLAYLWWNVPALRYQKPDWLVYGSLVILVASIVLRVRVSYQAQPEIRGKGYDGIINWALDKPFYYRLNALTILRSRGFQA